MKPLKWGDGLKRKKPRENQKAIAPHIHRVSRKNPAINNPKGAAEPAPVTLPYLKFLDPDGDGQTRRK